MKGKKVNINDNDDIGKEGKEERMKELKSKEKKNNSESVDIQHNRWKIEKIFIFLQQNSGTAYLHYLTQASYSHLLIYSRHYATMWLRFSSNRPNLLHELKFQPIS